MSTPIRNLDDLLRALDEGGALTYQDCGDFAKIYFNKSVGQFGEKPKTTNIRFLDPVNCTSDWQVEVELGMCGSVVDVYISKDDDGEDDFDDIDQAFL